MTSTCVCGAAFPFVKNDYCHQCGVPKNIDQKHKESVKGIKHDTKKYRFSLLPLTAIQETIKVLEFGAKKYAVDNWKILEDPETRYWDAAMRHMVAYKEGEQLDPESGIHHLAHASCCILFTLWFELKKEKTV